MEDPTQFRTGAVFDSETAPAFRQELQRAQSGIDAASDTAGLQRASADIRALAHRVIEQAPAEPMTRLISALNDALTRRVIELVSRDAQPQAPRWCWIALGSEGRQEQTLSSDQDNGIIFDGATADAARETMLPLALRINETLAACGFPLCRGGIMASNPQWCLSLHEWQERFANWIMEGDPQALLNATIFFDLRPLYGASELAHALGDWLAATASDNSRFLYQMAGNALQRKPPLGVLRDFVLEKSGEFAGTMDLKHNAATLFVDAARIYGLACGRHVSNTADRFRLAASMHRLNPDDAKAWVQAFYFIQMLRLKSQQRSYASGAAMHNHVDPNRLDAAERRALLDALRQARALQNRLGLDYLGSG